MSNGRDTVGGRKRSFSKRMNDSCVPDLGVYMRERRTGKNRYLFIAAI